jgi:hypothetical protein
MPMLTASDVADLLDIATDAQADHSLILYRPHSDGSGTTIAAQDVQVVYTSGRQARAQIQPGVGETLDDVTFYRESPFNVRKGDQFELDGHRGGYITATSTDPVLGLISASGKYDVTRAF